MSKHIMVDLETASAEPDAAILSIGAVIFDTENQELRREFYVNVSLQSCMEVGLRVSPDTFYWWAAQDSAAGKAIAANPRPLPEALNRFDAFVNSIADASKMRIWGNGATFDIPILETAFDAVGLTPGWKFWNVRCYRTISNMLDRDFFSWGADDGVRHNAIEDAKYQTNRLLAIASKLNLTLN